MTRGSRLETLVDMQSAQREALAGRILALIEQEWSSLGTWDARDVDRFLTRVLPIVSGGQKMTARIVDVHISQILSEMTGDTIPTVGLSGTDLENLRGVPAGEVYRRPFVEVWSALKNGELFADAIEVGRSRLNEIADDDMSLAYRHANRLTLERQPRVTGYRRIVRPELSKGGTCPLCHLAAENRYHKSELLPIHTHCRCAVMPIAGKSDPGARLNEADLGQMEKPNETPVIRHHGELGPILQIAGQHFTTEAQVA
jgi:hypothetical protein